MLLLLLLLSGLLLRRTCKGEVVSYVRLGRVRILGREHVKRKINVINAAPSPTVSHASLMCVTKCIDVDVKSLNNDHVVRSREGDLILESLSMHVVMTQGGALGEEGFRHA